MDNDFIKELEKSIIEVYSPNGEVIPFTKKEIKYYKHKYSSVQHESLTLFLDDVPLTGKGSNKRKVKYICSCGNISTICLCKFLKKTRLKCCKCREDEEKIAWHKLFFEERRLGQERGYRQYKTTIYDFDAESEEFKTNYYSRNLTSSEFDKIKKHIYSIGNRIVYGKDMILLEHEEAHNFKKYSQYVIVDNERIRLIDIQLKCPLCGNVFHITRPLKERVNAYNFDCKTCYLTNKTFGIKKLKDNLTYQSKEEKRFIDLCLERNIAVQNGITINYFWDNKPRTYITDFHLPKLNYLIEIKDNHIWHKKQVESGKWEAKEKAALDYCKKNNAKFYLLFPSDIDDFFKIIETDSLNEQKLPHN